MHDADTTGKRPSDMWVVADKAGRPLAVVPGSLYADMEANARRLPRVQRAIASDGGFRARRLYTHEVPSIEITGSQR